MVSRLLCYRAIPPRRRQQVSACSSNSALGRLFRTPARKSGFASGRLSVTALYLAIHSVFRANFLQHLPCACPRYRAHATCSSHLHPSTDADRAFLGAACSEHRGHYCCVGCLVPLHRSAGDAIGPVVRAQTGIAFRILAGRSHRTSSSRSRPSAAASRIDHYSTVTARTIWNWQLVARRSAGFTSMKRWWQEGAAPGLAVRFEKNEREPSGATHSTQGAFCAFTKLRLGNAVDLLHFSSGPIFSFRACSSIFSKLRS